jgi:hypothetical protein
MLHSDIKSRPTYRALEPDLAAAGHLLVIETATLQPGGLANLADAFAPVAAKLHTWLVGEALAVPGLGKPWHLPAVADVVDALACATRGYGIGDRLYVQGTRALPVVGGHRRGHRRLRPRSAPAVPCGQPAAPGVVHPTATASPSRSPPMSCPVWAVAVTCWYATTSPAAWAPSWA